MFNIKRKGAFKNEKQKSNSNIDNFFLSLSLCGCSGKVDVSQESSSAIETSEEKEEETEESESSEKETEVKYSQ